MGIEDIRPNDQTVVIGPTIGKKETNGDKVRQMDDAALAFVLAYCPYDDPDEALAWLKTETK